MQLQENDRVEGKNSVCLINFILVFVMRAPGIGQQLTFAEDIPVEGLNSTISRYPNRKILLVIRSEYFIHNHFRLSVTSGKL